ncbi:hypothetical protein HJB89_25310 [Rhizobium sp. NZLR8]|uniref:hypothetical protein n=1 Tax=Rhizobium sp. NZLR8 TaxID=2731104 RepID=UPI001C8401FB|nr:hypothetical protein [Rhizobium sp. NZLR8]MBX5160406.1 hypothetical protein [Rhizobium sp. NZLR8]
MMELEDSPLARLLKSVLSVNERETGAYEDPSVPPGGGKWSEHGVPHKGWHVVDYYKLDDREQLCEMCERQMVMFVHVMRHEEYADDLKVGCVCAGHMENDIEGARQREVRYRNRSKRRDNWLSRKWQNSCKTGGHYLRTDGMVISVYPVSDYWSAGITHRASKHKRSASRRYKTSDEAKLAAFDVMMNWLEKKPWENPMRRR